jgi:protein required for attachment to host cells
LQKAFDRLIVAASPRALGTFRATAPKALMSLVVKEIAGDYVNGDEEQFLAALVERA